MSMDTVKKYDLKMKCIHCNKEGVYHLNIEPAQLAPNIKGMLRPSSINYEYNVSSDDIKKFIIDTTRQYVPDAKVEIVTRYCEKKHKGGPHRSYAAFKIAFSHHVMANDGDDSWFRRIGESGGNVKIIQTLYDNLIKRWKYDDEYVNDWLKSYKKLEQLEEGLGITESFINEIKEFNRPKGIPVPGSNEIWVTFMACPEKIISDFFAGETDDSFKPVGKISIVDIVQVSKPPKEIVNYKIMLNPYQVETTENPHVRQILSGNDKN